MQGEARSASSPSLCNSRNTSFDEEQKGDRVEEACAKSGPMFEPHSLRIPSKWTAISHEKLLRQPSKYQGLQFQKL